MEYSGFLDQHLASATFFDDPYPVYSQLQKEAPIHWSDTWNAWVLTRYDDVIAALRNPEQFSSAGRQLRLLQQLSHDQQLRLQPLRQHYAMGGIINSDPPNHTRLRRLVSSAFTPRAVNRLRPRIQQLVDDLLDAALQQREIDLIHDFAFPLPAVVIAEMLGAPAEDREQFKEWSEQINAFLGTGRPDAAFGLRSQASLQRMKSYLSDLLAERMRKPQDDLLSSLADVSDEGDSLSDDELLATGVTLLIAGHETTTNLIGNGLLALLRHPEQVHHLRQDASLISRSIEEMLRYDGPAHSLKRVTTVNVRVGEHSIPEGALIYLLLGAANRDPAHFSYPHEFNIQREEREHRHIAFGYGIHFCVGAPLARLEGAIAISSLLRNVKDIQLTGTPQWNPNISVRGLETFPVILRS